MLSSTCLTGRHALARVNPSRIRTCVHSSPRPPNVSTRSLWMTQTLASISPDGYSKYNNLLRTSSQQQVRTYLYIPVSLSELLERFDRWVEKAETRIINVKLLSRKRSTSKDLSTPSSTVTKSSLASRSRSYLASTRVRIKGKQRQWKRWMTRQRMRATTSLTKRSSGSNVPSLIRPSGRIDDLRSRYTRWKARKTVDFRSWEVHRREQYSGWKQRRKDQVQRWSARKDRAWVRTRQILLHEYSRPEWFDSVGRPLTSRDSTGRFVNPWLSQSTNGVHSFGTLLNWKWQRFQRELKQVGLANMLDPTSFLPPWLSSSTLTSQVSDSPLANQRVPSLPTAQDSTLQFTWLGHATCLVYIDTTFTVLVDPVFSVRASPFQNLPIGFPREVPPSCTVEELVEHQRRSATRKHDAAGCTETISRPIDFCCITHDHYDHLDRDSVLELKDHVDTWITPLGVGDWLVEKCDVDPKRVIQLEWWEQVQLRKVDHTAGIANNINSSDYVGVKVVSQHAMTTPHDGSIFIDNITPPDESHKDLTITCCPASHWASRALWDRNFRLWCSFAFKTPSYRFFICGDTSYPESFPLFRQIGDALGPFDLAAIPIGAYEPKDLNKDSHVNPSEAVQIHRDIGSRKSVALHWGTFRLSEEPMYAPPIELKDAVEEYNNTASTTTPVQFDVLGHGQTMAIKETDAIASNDVIVESSFSGLHDDSHLVNNSTDDSDETYNPMTASS